MPDDVEQFWTMAWTHLSHLVSKVVTLVAEQSISILAPRPNKRRQHVCEYSTSARVATNSAAESLVSRTLESGLSRLGLFVRRVYLDLGGRNRCCRRQVHWWLQCPRPLCIGVSSVVQRNEKRIQKGVICSSHTLYYLFIALYQQQRRILGHELD